MSNEFVLNDKLYRDVTSMTKTGRYDEDCVSLLKCVCNETFENWEKTISIYPDEIVECTSCGRKLYAGVTIKVYEELGPAPSVEQVPSDEQKYWIEQLQHPQCKCGAVFVQSKKPAATALNNLIQHINDAHLKGE